jgi:hypothetical protein
VKATLGGEREAALFGDGNEVTEVSELHGHHASRVWLTKIQSRFPARFKHYIEAHRTHVTTPFEAERR